MSNLDSLLREMWSLPSCVFGVEKRQDLILARRLEESIVRDVLIMIC